MSLSSELNVNLVSNRCWKGGRFLDPLAYPQSATHRFRKWEPAPYSRSLSWRHRTDRPPTVVPEVGYGHVTTSASLKHPVLQKYVSQGLNKRSYGVKIVGAIYRFIGHFPCRDRVPRFLELGRLESSGFGAWGPDPTSDS